MNASDLKATWLGGASWQEIEHWPLRTRRLAMGLMLLLSLVVSGGLVAWPAHANYRKATIGLAQTRQSLSTAQGLIAGMPAQRTELNRMKGAAKDPMDSAVILGFLESDDVAAIASDGGYRIEGEGSASTLIAWLETLRGSPRPPLVRWTSMQVSRSADGGLAWTGQLTRLDAKAIVPPNEPSSEAHATSMGRDPFLALNRSVALKPLTTEAAMTLPSEDSWPKPEITDWPLAKLRMVGVLLEPAPVRGLVMAGAKTLYEVRIGDRVGMERKTVQRVSSRELQMNGAALSIGPMILDKAP